MIEIAILDVVERLLSSTPPMPMLSVSPIAFQIGGLSIASIYSADSTVASSLGQSLASSMNPAVGSYPSPDYTKIWVGAPTSYSTSKKCMLLDLAADTITFDDTGARGLVQIVTDNAGTVWAQSTVNFGLWKRTAAGTWTQMLTDTTVAVGVRYRPSDNTYWYQSSTGNHYLLANGAATLQSAPTGTLVGLLVQGDFLGLDAPYFGSNNPTFAGPAPVFYNADGSVNATPVLPMEAFINCGVGSWPFTARQIHLDATYSLLVQTPFLNSVYPGYALYMVNKTTGVIRYIGFLPVVSLKGGVVSGAGDMVAFAAKWTGNGMRVYFRGMTIAYSAITTAGCQGGVIKVDVPYQPNF